MHAPYRLKRYRFFEIGHDHYYYDDMATKSTLTGLYRPRICRCARPSRT